MRHMFMFMFCFFAVVCVLLLLIFYVSPFISKRQGPCSTGSHYSEELILLQTGGITGDALRLFDDETPIVFTAPLTTDAVARFVRINNVVTLQVNGFDSWTDPAITPGAVIQTPVGFVPLQFRPKSLFVKELIQTSDGISRYVGAVYVFSDGQIQFQLNELNPSNFWSSIENNAISSFQISYTLLP